MKIKEVSQQTGLTKRTIRFYEAQSLIAPEKTCQNGKEFRTYSEENVQQLKKIATLRRARFSVEEIRRMQEAPEDTTAVFHAYRQRLREEQQSLTDILAVVDAIPEESLSSPDDLISHMESVAAGLPLPALDVRPHFRYLDELADISGEARRTKKARQEKQRREDIDLALHTTVSEAARQKACARDLSPGNEQKFAILQMLRDDKHQ